MTKISDLKMAHEYIVANAKAGIKISVKDSFKYVESLHLEAVKRGRKKLINALDAHRKLHPQCNITPLPPEIEKSLGEIP